MINNELLSFVKIFRSIAIAFLYPVRCMLKPSGLWLEGLVWPTLFKWETLSLSTLLGENQPDVFISFHVYFHALELIK